MKEIRYNRQDVQKLISMRSPEASTYSEGDPEEDMTDKLKGIWSKDINTYGDEPAPEAESNQQSYWAGFMVELEDIPKHIEDPDLSYSARTVLEWRLEIGK
jgi:hypothetical protein